MSRMRKTLLLPFLLLAGLTAALLAPQVWSQSQNRVALVIRDDTGGVYTQCIQFDEPQISGYDVLLRSGLEVAAEVQGMGALVCSIDGLGCSADNCLCECQGGGDCVYWSYWLRPDDAWVYSAGGATQLMASDGDIQGWSWGPGSVTNAIPPPDISFGDVCQIAVTPTATATPTPTPTPSATPLPAPQVAFSADAATITSGSCTTLRWQVANVSAVYLDGNGVTGSGALDVCPQQTQSHALRFVYAGGEETRTVTVTVLAAPTAPAPSTTPSTPTPQAAATAAPTATAQPAQPVAQQPPTTDAPATNTPAAVAVASAETPPPNPSATPTATAIWIVAPALPTDTSTPAAVAELVATPEPPAPAVTSTSDTSDGVGQWAPYAVFAAIVLGLGGLLLAARRR